MTENVIKPSLQTSRRYQVIRTVVGGGYVLRCRAEHAATTAPENGDMPAF